MEIELSLEKSIEENASAYFEKAKKARKKLEGLKKAIGETKKKIAVSGNKVKEQKTFLAKAKKQWFHSFHWFFSSDGFLVIAGKDAKSNEAIVKKHLGSEDLFLHADIHGASACIVKANGKAIPEQTLREAASFAAVFSRAWKQGISAVDVYAVKAGQVSKKAPSGESLGTGAFMIYGKRQWFRKMPMELYAGARQSKSGLEFVSGPEQAVKKQSLAIVKIVQGTNSAEHTAKTFVSVMEKKFGKKLRAGIDEVVSMLPSGSMQLVQ